MKIISLITEIFTAIGTVAVAILAIWGDSIKERLFTPALQLALHERLGDYNFRHDGRSTIYYHFVVSNLRPSRAAKHVRVVVEEISKRTDVGKYKTVPVIAPLQFTWAYPEFHDRLSTIRDNREVCDLGFAEEASARFALSLYATPNSFQGFISRSESMRLKVVAYGSNCKSASLQIEVSWNGKWDPDPVVMSRNLTVTAL